MTTPLTILAPALQRAEDDPDGIALWVHARGRVTAVSNRELILAARRYASVLRRAGVGRGDIVILMLDHSVDQYTGFIGAMLVGAIPSFMPPLTKKQSPTLYWAAHAALFERITPRALIIADERVAQLRSHIAATALAVITPDDAAVAAPDLGAPIGAAPDDVAFLQHSSGTTQLKKGVQLSHRAILAQVAAYGAALHVMPADRIASWLPLYHDMGLIACFIAPLVLGVPVASLDPFEWVVAPDLLLRAIAEHRCTLTWMPNFAFHHLARLRRSEVYYDLESMRAWIDCSEPCRPATFDLFAESFADCGVTADRLQVCYAMAETVFAVSQTPIGRPVNRLRVDPACLRSAQQVSPRPPDMPGTDLLSAGRILPGLRVSILSDNGVPLPDGHVGEIAVSGDFLFEGYFRLPERTAERLVGGWYRTADQGFLWNGDLYVLGRLDDLIIVNGRNFYCHELEHIASAIPGIKPGRAAAFPVDDAAGGTQAAVVVAECDDPHGPESRALKRRLKEEILSRCDLTVREAALVPAGWIVKTTSGKVSRVENRAKYLRDLGGRS